MAIEEDEEGPGLCLPPEEWVRCAGVLREYSRDGYGESQGGTALGGFAAGSIVRYAGLLEEVAKDGGSVRRYLDGLAAKRTGSSSFRGTWAAVRLCGRLGLLGGYGDMAFEDRMAQLTRKHDLPSTRLFLDDRHLVEMASTRRDWAILGMGVVSLAFLLRVGEAALLSPSDFGGGGGDRPRYGMRASREVTSARSVPPPPIGLGGGNGEAPSSLPFRCP